MKVIYDFVVPKKVIVKESKQNEDGSETIKKVEKVKNIKIGLKKPNRLEREEADMIYAKRLSECIRAGLLTSAQLSKEYSALGGVWSEQEKSEYAALQKEYETISLKYNDSQIKYSANPTKTNKKVMGALYFNLQEIYTRMKSFEEHKSEVFNETADVKAKNRVLTWYLCFLSYCAEEEGKWIELFKGKTFEDKLDDYDRIVEDGEEWEKIAVEKSMLLLTFWYAGKISTQEDIKLIEDLLGANPDETIENLPEVDEENG